MRGINVGGNNLIKMADLKIACEKIGLRSITTFIQSGNVLFEADETANDLTILLEKKLSQQFNYQSRVLILTKEELRQVVEEAPTGFGSKPTEYRYDVIFLLPPVSADQAASVLPLNPAVDHYATGPGVVYFWRLISKASQSRLPRIIQTPIYKQVTIRNWNTTSKLLELIDQEPDTP
jgi:uncharacterized protein (DUF1697 family)